MKFSSLIGFVIIGGAACGDDASAPKDAAIDAKVDAVSVDAGRCGTDLAFEGEFIDWSSTDADFCGIFMATWQVHGDPTRTRSTPPNGRVELCLAPAATTQIDVTPPTGASPCAAMPGSYTLPGVAFASQAVLDAGGVFSARSITAAELQQLGLTLDPTKAQVFVHVDGAMRAVSLSSTHDAAIAFDGTSWAPGNTGQNVFFPNTDVASGNTTVQVTGGASGTGSVAVKAATFTYTTVLAN